MQGKIQRDYKVDWDKPAIVLDNGSGLVKIGFSGEYSRKILFLILFIGEDMPRNIFPAVVGRPMYAATLPR
jgi:actin-related protein